VPAFLSQRGRACFYLYVGSVNLGAFPPEDSFWRLIHFSIGFSLVAVAAMMFAHSCCRRHHTLHVPAPADCAAELLHEALAAAGGELFFARSLVQESHCTLRTLAACVALALLASSLLGVLGLFGAVFEPFQYTVAFYNVVFALVVLIVDGAPRAAGHALWRVQRRLLHSCHFLATCRGRALLYFYVGSVNLAVMSPRKTWHHVYIGLGGSLCLISVLSLLQRHARLRSGE